MTLTTRTRLPAPTLFVLAPPPANAKGPESGYEWYIDNLAITIDDNDPGQEDGGDACDDD